jgi:FkbM family methyltransferase
MKRSLKTKLFDSIRKLWAKPFGERILLRYSTSADVNQMITKFIPMPYLFPTPSWRVVKRHGLSLSLDISDFVDWYVYFDLKDDALNCLLAQVGDQDHIIDIGTNIGYVSLRCSQKARHGKVTGFEPSAYNFNKAINNLALNPFIQNLSVNRIALGSSQGELNLKSGGEHNRGMSSITIETDSSSIESVPVRRLDDWFRENGERKVNLIKLDVEGFEMEVLKGAEWVIANHRPRLFIEVDKAYLTKFGATPESLYGWLRKFNYRIFDIRGKEITREEELSIRHMDILAIPS